MYTAYHHLRPRSILVASSASSAASGAAAPVLPAAQRNGGATRRLRPWRPGDPVSTDGGVGWLIYVDLRTLETYITYGFKERMALRLWNSGCWKDGWQWFVWKKGLDETSVHQAGSRFAYTPSTFASAAYHQCSFTSWLLWLVPAWPVVLKLNMSVSEFYGFALGRDGVFFNNIW